MAKRGPKPTPLSMRGQRGSRIKMAEKGAQASLAFPPSLPDMSKEVKALWEYYCEVLYDIGVLTNADQVAVLRLAEATAAVNKFNNIIKKEGPVMRMGAKKNKDGVLEGGYYQITPYSSLRKAAWREEQVLLASFGLTPSSWARLDLAPLPSATNVTEESEAMDLID